MSQYAISQLGKWITADLEVARARVAAALATAGAGELVWHGERFWLDKRRRLVLVASSVAEVSESAWATPETLPESDPEAEDLLDVYGGDSLLVDGGSLLRLWALLASGRGHEQTWSPDGARLLNFAVMQPLVNPAFESLFWWALADGLGPAEDSGGDLVRTLGPMMFQLRHYPTLVPAEAEVRAAQVAFVERMAPGSTDAACAGLSPLQWSERCARELQARQSTIERNVYAHVYARLGDRELAPLG